MSIVNCLYDDVIQALQYFQMNWLFQSKSPRTKPQQVKEDIQEYPATLQEDDFITIIKLEDKYNHYKSLIKVQQLNNINEQTNQKNMLKVMTELIQYYAQCITEAERNVQNIVRYFQLKIKHMNNHYIKVFDKQKKIQDFAKEFPDQHPNKELGNIQISIKHLKLPEAQTLPEKQEKYEKEQKNRNTPEVKDIKDIKSNMNKNLMIALQNQNIQQHLEETHKKADFLKKSIANSIQMQEDFLQKRIQQGKKKKISFATKDNDSNAATAETSQMQGKKYLKKCKTLKQLKKNYSSDSSELDEAQRRYIQNFVVEQQLNAAHLKEEDDMPKSK